MHYYQFNIGDYKSHTDHLTNLEDLGYRRLLDWLYLHEKPLPIDENKVARLVKMSDNEQEITTVLNEFFEKTDEGWIHNRVDDELAQFKAKQDVARANGKKGGRPKAEDKPKKTKPVNSANQEESGLKTNHKPITKNQEPITKEKSLCKANASPDDVNIVFDYWLTTMQKPLNQTKLTPKRKKAIQDRLKDGYDLGAIKAAIYNCSLDPFSMGYNDRAKPFNDIELICRSGEKLESFMEKQVTNKKEDPYNFAAIDAITFDD